MLLTLVMLCLSSWALSADRPWAPMAEQWFALQNVEAKPDDSRAALRVLSGSADRADVIVLGDSAISEALLSDAELDRALLARGIKARVVNLASPAQRATDAVYFARLLQPRPGQTFVLHLRFTTLRRIDPFATLAAGQHLQLPDLAPNEPSVLAPPLRSVPQRLQLEWRLARENLRRRVANPLRRWVAQDVYGVPAPTPAKHHFNQRIPHHDTVFLDAQRKTAQQELDSNFQRNLPLFAAALEELVTLIEQGGARVVLAEAPHADASLEHANRTAAEQFEQVVEAVGLRHRLQRIDLNAAIDWTPQDVADLSHVNARGRERWSRAFVEWLVADRAESAR